MPIRSHVLCMLAIVGLICAVPSTARGEPSPAACEGGPSATTAAPQGLTLCTSPVRANVVTHDEPQVGVRIAALSADSPLAAAGLAPGDVIYRVRFTRVTTPQELLRALGPLELEHGLVINFWRGPLPYLVRVWTGAS